MLCNRDSSTGTLRETRASVSIQDYHSHSPSFTTTKGDLLVLVLSFVFSSICPWKVCRDYNHVDTCSGMYSVLLGSCFLKSYLKDTQFYCWVLCLFTMRITNSFLKYGRTSLQKFEISLCTMKCFLISWKMYHCPFSVNFTDLRYVTQHDCMQNQIPFVDRYCTFDHEASESGSKVRETMFGIRKQEKHHFDQTQDLACRFRVDSEYVFKRKH